MQEEAFSLVRGGKSVVIAAPTGVGKTLPMIVASLDTDKQRVCVHCAAQDLAFFVFVFPQPNKVFRNN